MRNICTRINKEMSDAHNCDYFLPPRKDLTHEVSRFGFTAGKIATYHPFFLMTSESSFRSLALPHI
jgi:hypothetical protein